MKKFILTFSVLVVFVLYIVVSRKSVTSSAVSTSPIVSIAPVATSTPGDTLTTTVASGSTPPAHVATTPVAVTPVATKPTGQYKDGQYTGQGVDVFYGTLQLQVTVAGGKITDITALNYPKDRDTSLRISQQAIPRLVSEAIQSQSANVDAVSGASDTSAGFKQSLAAILSQIKI